jgi:hypothetical protein
VARWVQLCLLCLQCPEEEWLGEGALSYEVMAPSKPQSSPCGRSRGKGP